jgi:hypothetical protein
MPVDFSQYLRILRAHAPEGDSILALEERLRSIVAEAYRPVTAGSAGLYFYTGKPSDADGGEADDAADDDEDDGGGPSDEEESFWKEELLFYAPQSQQQMMMTQPLPTASLMRRNPSVGVFPFPFFLKVDPISTAVSRASSAIKPNKADKAGVDTDIDADEDALGESNGMKDSMGSGTELSDYGDDTYGDDTDVTDATDIGEDTDTGTDGMTPKPLRSFSTDTDTDDPDIQVLISLFSPSLDWWMLTSGSVNVKR